LKAAPRKPHFQGAAMPGCDNLSCLLCGRVLADDP
jgi:hypothetical protein